jgi:hypothetical protein
MKRIGVISTSCLLCAVGIGAVAAMPAQAGFVHRLFFAELSGYEEVPALSTTGRGWFAASIRGNTIAYKLHYETLEGGEVHQGHIHFGQKAVNGGVSAFLCSNLGNAPAGTPACPPAPATVSGTIEASDVVGPAGQEIDPGEIDELIAAIQAGVTYANVHTTQFPAGEIRGQIRSGLGR